MSKQSALRLVPKGDATTEKSQRLTAESDRPGTWEDYLVKRRTLAIASGKGGTGKTNLAVNLALALTQRGKQVLLVDGDLGLAGVDLLLGMSPRHTLRDVVLGRKQVEDVILTGPGGVRVLPAANGVEELANLDDFRRERLVRSIRDLDEELDFVIVDTGAGIGRNVTSLAFAADEVVVVTTPEPPSFSDAYALIKVLARRTLGAPPRLVVNRVSGQEEWQDVASRIALVSRRFLHIELTQWGYVYEDPAVGQAVQKQEALLEAFPQSLASKCVHQLASRVLEDPGRHSYGLEGFLRRVEDPDKAEEEALE